jgi:hypothetical protein
MDLSSLTAPPATALAGMPGVESYLSASAKELSASARSFGRSTQDFSSYLKRGLQGTRQVARGGSTMDQVGGVAKIFGSGLSALTGLDIAGPIGVGMQVFSLASSLFGGKKPSVGPGGGIGFGVGPDGQIQIGFSSQDNGYDPIAANSSAAQSVANAAAQIIERMGGRFTGTAVAGRGAELGYDAGVKMFTGGDDTSEGRGRFKTIEAAMAASVTAILRNATTSGLSKDLGDRLSMVASEQDLEGLLHYVDGLRSVHDAFVNWREPMGRAESAMAALNASFEQAKFAAESLSQSTDAVQAAYARQQEYLVQEFNAGLIHRELRATGQTAAADALVRARAEADLRKQAAALGADAVLQVEKTLAAERARDAATAQQARLQPIVDSYTGMLNSIADGLARGVQQWTELAQSVQAFNDSLDLSALSPLSPQERLALAQSQYSDLLGKAMGGDATAAQGVTGAAERLLSEGRGFYASSQGYADLYGLVRSDLGELSGFAGQTMPARLQEEARARAKAIREMMNAELKSIRGFAGGGVTNPGEMVRVHPGELLYTGPQTRVFNARETTAILNGGGDGAAIKELLSEVRTLIRVTAAAGQMNAETQAQMAETLDAIRRKASLVAAA